MSQLILERTIRAFIREGTGLDAAHVQLGRKTTNAPDGVYASVTLMQEIPMGMPTHQQVIGDDASYTIDSQMLMSTYDIQFFRDGAFELAHRFANWARSETGTTWAATSLTCGRLAGVNVYSSGTGYGNGDTCTFTHDVDDPSNTHNAVGVIETDAQTGIRAITLNSGGAGYSIMPSVVFSGSGTGSSISPRGYGFAIDRIKVRNLSKVISGEFEDRAQIDLDIQHKRIYNDLSSGRVERIIGEQDNVIYDSDNT